MTLQQLYYFVEACRYGNISHAANDIGISQPSVSTAIKSLEEEFEVTVPEEEAVNIKTVGDIVKVIESKK